MPYFFTDNLSDGSSVSSYQLPGLSSYYSSPYNAASNNGNVSSLNIHPNDESLNDNAGANMADNFAGLAAVYQMRDIDSFIANLTVPPPPSSTTSVSSTDDLLLKASKKVLSGKQGGKSDGVLSQEDISGNCKCVNCGGIAVCIFMVGKV